MQEKVVRYGVLGMGRGLEIVLEGKGDPRGLLVAACDKNEKAVSKAKKKLSENGFTDCVFYDTYEQMLASDIDAVIIATDAVCHVPYVLQAFDAGKHVLCEIPSVKNLEEAYALKAAVEAHPELIYMAAENCCYWAFVETWKQMNEEGQFGDIVYAEGEYLHSIDPENFSKDNYPEGHWRITLPAIRYITHELGPLLYILDDRCVSVTCMESDVVYNPYFPEKRGTGTALFKTEKGRIIHVLISFGSYTSPTHNFRILGTSGSIETDRLKKVYQAHSYANLKGVPQTFKTKLEIPITTGYEEDRDSTHGGGDRRMLSDFLRCVSENVKPKLDVDFALKMTLPGIFAHESAIRNGVPVDIPVI